MDNIIYWYSGTGNSLSAARRLAEHLHGETVLLPVTALLYGYEQPAAAVCTEPAWTAGSSMTAVSAAAPVHLSARCITLR